MLVQMVDFVKIYLTSIEVVEVGEVVEVTATMQKGKR